MHSSHFRGHSVPVLDHRLSIAAVPNVHLADATGHFWLWESDPLFSRPPRIGNRCGEPPRSGARRSDCSAGCPRCGENSEQVITKG